MKPGYAAPEDQQYKAVFEATSDGLVITDPEQGLILAANPAFCQMHGHDAMEGMPPTAFVHPRSLYVFRKLLEGGRVGEKTRYRGQTVHRDGSVLDVEISGRSFQYEERFALLVVVRDITEQIRSEQLLESRVEARTREIETLLGIGRAVASTLDSKQLTRLILEQLKSVVDYKAASLILIEDDDLVVHDLVIDKGVDASAPVTGLRFPRAQLPFAWKTTDEQPSNLEYPCVQVAASPEFWVEMDRGRPVVIADVHKTQTKIAEDYRVTMGVHLDNPILALMQTWMAVPLIVKDQLIGYIGVSSDTPGLFTDKHVRLTRAFADHASVAIENARLYQHAQQLAAVEERQRLARDLHDSVAQALYGIALGAKAARRYLPEDGVAALEPIDYVVSLASAGLAEMRALIFDLHPESIETDGLISAINRQILALQARHHLTIAPLSCPEPEVPVAIKEGVYGIIRESLHNVVKHSQAQRVQISVGASDVELRFDVVDDGNGFEPNAVAPGHLGLRSMRERAAKLGGEVLFESAPGKGTRVMGVIPVSS